MEPVICPFSFLAVILWMKDCRMGRAVWAGALRRRSVRRLETISISCWVRVGAGAKRMLVSSVYSVKITARWLSRAVSFSRRVGE